MASAGMMMSVIVEAVKSGKIDVPDHETRRYLAEKLEEAFFSIQSDITEAVVSVAQNMTESGDQ